MKKTCHSERSTRKAGAESRNPHLAGGKCRSLDFAFRCAKGSARDDRWLTILLSLFAVGCVGGAASGGMADRGESRPNVVVILTDDQGWGDLGLHGNLNLQTPHIDGLARAGAAFDHFYVQPVCSPTRAEFLTGRYHVRMGVYGTSAGGERMDLRERTLAEAFQEAGYATAVFGKWHNGTQWPYHPNARGFDEFYGFASGHWGHYFDWVLERNGALVEGEGYLPDDLTSRAIEFIHEHRDEPFFVYIPYNTPHSPMQVPDRFYEKFDEADLRMRHHEPEKEDVEHTRAALAMVENLDWNVGRLLETLEETGLDEETIVLYFHDNGPNGWRWNGGLRGRKGSTDEGGVRSPLFVRWPGHIPAGLRVPQVAGAIDLLPTLTDLAAVQRVGSQPLDGVSLAPLLSGSAGTPGDRMLFAHWNGRTSVRTQRYRLDHEGRLYDIAADPGQTRDVAAELPELAARLSRAVREWEAATISNDAPDQRPFPVGYPEFPLTHLPARDGVAHGGIERSNRFPNASFFRSWESAEDSITWDVQVATEGRYEAVVHYTARPEDVGATVQLSFGPRRAVARVTEAYDPPLVGAAQDRVPRQESYVKRFRPLPLGVLDLPAGRGTLTLRALKVPGPQVMDVRGITLRLVK